MKIFNGLKNRFNHPSTKFEKAVSWAFFNNGNVVDKTRLRIIDGTPLHTTGLPRIMHDWHFATMVGVTSLSAIASQHLHETLPLLCGLTAGTGGSYIAHRIQLKNMFGSQCFNTLKNDSDTNIENHSNAAYMLSTNNIIVYLNSFFSSMQLLSMLTGNTSFLNGLNSPVFIEAIRIQKQFSKVTEGEWSIESAPPPKKKELKETLSLQDIFPTLVPQPKIAYMKTLSVKTEILDLLRQTL